MSLRLRRPCREHLAVQRARCNRGTESEGLSRATMSGEGHADGCHGVALMGCHVCGVALRLVAAGSASSLRRGKAAATLPATLPARPASFLSEVSCAW